MAQVDWDFDHNGGTGTMIGGPDGQAQLNSGLSSPLVGEGSYCRKFRRFPIVNAGNDNAYVKSSVAGGAFYNTPSTKAVSLRALMRVASDSSDASLARAISIYGKSQSHIGAGYFVSLGTETNGTQGAFAARLQARDINNVPVPPDVVLPGSWLVDTWYRLRMDIVPMINNADLVRVYLGTGVTGAEIWTQIGSKVFSLAGSNGFLPWGNNCRFGFFINSEGFGGASDSGTRYIDSFQALTKDGGPF